MENVLNPLQLLNEALFPTQTSHLQKTPDEGPRSPRWGQPYTTVTGDYVRLWGEDGFFKWNLMIIYSISFDEGTAEHIVAPPWHPGWDRTPSIEIRPNLAPWTLQMCHSENIWSFYNLRAFPTISHSISSVSHEELETACYFFPLQLAKFHFSDLSGYLSCTRVASRNTLYIRSQTQS